MYNIYVGSDVGLLKGVNTSQKKYENLNDINEIDKGSGILSMCWNDADENEILLGLKNHDIKIFDCKSNTFNYWQNLNMGEGTLKNVAKLNDLILTSVDSGTVRLWDKGEMKMDIKSGPHLSVMRPNNDTSNVFATGGKDSNLKVWDINKHEKPIFKAKNVPANFLDIRMPIWIKELQFIPQSKKILTGTAYHQIRLYDLSTSNKRPVVDMEFGENPISSIALTSHPDQFVVGNNYGRMGLIDLRKQRLIHAFKKISGSIRCIQVHPTLPIVVSSCIDRFLRFHDLQAHTLMDRLYLKSKLGNLLLCTKDPKRTKLFFDI